jgi:hypothetical protein
MLSRALAKVANLGLGLESRPERPRGSLCSAIVFLLQPATCDTCGHQEALHLWETLMETEI